MSDDLECFALNRRPSPDRPLQGLTVLVVEDSRFASEAIRLLCLRSGARIRRADCLAAAHRHLQVYRPTILIVDMGLPDGSGSDLIRDLDQMVPRVPVILGISGDDGTGPRAFKAGADGFLAKPIESLAAFQQAVLDILPPGEGPLGPRVLPSDLVVPDRLALRDDLTHIADVIHEKPQGRTLNYIAQFLGGVARSAHDPSLEAAAASLAQACAHGRETEPTLSRLAGIVEDRIAHSLAL